MTVGVLGIIGFVIWLIVSMTKPDIDPTKECPRNKPKCGKNATLSCTLNEKSGNYEYHCQCNGEERLNNNDIKAKCDGDHWTYYCGKNVIPTEHVPDCHGSTAKCYHENKEIYCR
jgi:hypothetical protein